MLTAIIYARVSTEDQVEKYGLPVQLRACRECAAARGFEVIEEIADEGISGAILERPGLERVRRLVRDGAVDAVLMLDPDRLSRELIHLLILKPEIEKRARLEFVTSTFDNTPTGDLFFSLKGAIAKYERAVTRDRTMRGRKERALAGKIVGGVIAYGYCCEDGLLAPDELRAQIVRDIFRWYDDGCSMRSIVRKLRESGAPTMKGRPWAHCSVRHILLNETYTGVAHYNKRRREVMNADDVLNGPRIVRLVPRNAEEWIPLSVPPLVDRAQWERVRARIAENPWRGRPSAKYLLRGLLFCSCGRRMTGERMKSRSAYRCIGRNNLIQEVERCRCAVNAASLDDLAWREVTKLYTEADFLRSIITQHQEALCEADPAQFQQLEARVRKLKARESTALSMMLDPDLAADRATIKAEYRQAQAERVRVEGELAMARRGSRPTGPAGWVEDTLAMVRAYIPQIATAEQRQEFVRGVLSRADWDGKELKMRCFIGPKMDSTSRRDEQFRALEVILTARFAA